MKPSASNVGVRLALLVGLGMVAYLTGRWQGILELAAQPVPKVRSPYRIALAARETARAKAYADYLERKKFLHTVLEPHPAADAGIDLAKDLKGGLEKLASLPPGQKTQSTYWDAFETWAKDPQQGKIAAAAAEALATSLERTAALKGVARGWAQDDPKGSLDWASNLPGTDVNVLKEAMAGVTDLNNQNRQPALAAQYVDKLTDATLRNAAIADIGREWGWSYLLGGGTDDTVAALNWLDQTATGATYDDTVRQIFNQLTGPDPMAAAAMIDKVTDPDVRKTLISRISSSLGSKDPNALLQWAQSLPDSDQDVRATANHVYVSSLALSDPAAAAAYVQNSPNPAEFLPNADSIATGLASYDPQAALTWSNSLPDGDVKNKALNDVLVKISSANFAGAWNDAVNLPDASTAVSIMGNLVSTLAKKDPAQAVALVAQFPTDAAQLSATSSVASTWAVQDASGFAAWVNTLPPGSQHDAAVAAGLKAVQGVKLPAPERASLVQSLTQAIQGKPAP